MALVPKATTHQEIELFLWMAIITVIQKYLAIIVAGGAEAAVVGRQMVREHLAKLESPTDFDIYAYTGEALRSIPWPARPFVSRIIAAAMSGDVGIHSRLMAKLAQVQGACVGIEAILFLVGVWRLASGIPI
ncbi:MAG: hypothetical protein ACRD3Q_15865 [Terriglobales bacterium]